MNYLKIWDSVMKNDTQTLDKTLDLSGWQVESNDHWELYDIIDSKDLIVFEFISPKYHTGT